MKTDIYNMNEYIRYLSTMIGVRPIGSHALELSAEYICEMMKQNKLDVSFQPFNWEGKEQDLSEHLKGLAGKHYLRNVVGVKKAKNTAKSILIFGAHYDTVPVARGAMDNASGVATVLELSRALSEIDNNDIELRFIAFAGEEVGCVGSKAYLESLSKEEKEKIVAVFNFDMFATRGDEEVALVCGTCGGTNETPYDNAVSKNVARAFSELEIKDIELWSPRNYGHSDHQTFCNAGIDSANVTIRGTKARNGKLPWGYHSEKDVFMQYDLSFMQKCIEVVYYASLHIINND